jgi:hypothetical protein
MMIISTDQPSIYMNSQQLLLVQTLSLLIKPVNGQLPQILRLQSAIEIQLYLVRLTDILMVTVKQTHQRIIDQMSLEQILVF